MNDFIGNNIKVISEWGQWVAVLIVLVTGSFLYLIIYNRKKHAFLIEMLRWFMVLVGFLIIIVSSLVFARITQIKPGAQRILNRLDSLRNNTHPPLVFRLVTDSSEHNLDEYKGKIVLINFWATWCGPCLKEMPELSRLQHENQDLVVITLSDEKKPRLLRYLAKHPNETVSVYVDKFNWVNLGSERPATFLIDQQGTIREYYTGSYDFDHFQNEVEKVRSK